MSHSTFCARTKLELGIIGSWHGSQRYLCYWILLIVSQLVFVVHGEAQTYGPPAVWHSGFLYMPQGTVSGFDTYAAVFSEQSSSPIKIGADYNVFIGDAAEALTTYDPTTGKFADSTAFASVSSDCLSFLGLNSGVTVRANLGSNEAISLYDGIWWQAPPYSFVAVSGVYVCKFLNLSDGLIFQINGSPFYRYSAASEFVIDLSSGSWPSSNLFAIPPQNVYVNASTFNLSSVGVSSGPGYYLESLNHAYPVYWY